MRASAKASLALAAALLAAGAWAQPAPAPAPARAPGFLSPQELPDTLKLIPPPPQPGSAEEAADRAAWQDTRKLAGAPRWEQAIADVALRTPDAYRSWSCAADVKISAETTPRTVQLMQRVLSDAGLSAYPPKNHYKRVRPMTGNDLPACVTRESLGADPSYPSGHASVGWAWALVLSELRPERADALLQRGHDFGESRIVCGVHYPSDVQSGRLIGAAVVARLHADEEFQAAMAESKAELAKVGAKPEGCGA